MRWWWIGGAVISLTGAVLLARQAIDEQRALFETDARIVHRLLSQQVVQHDAILDTLALLQPGPEAPGATPPEQRLPALYPHILSVQRRDRGGDWPDPALAGAETASRQHQRPALATVELGSGRYRLVLAAEPTAYALGIDLRAMVPWAEWPMKPETSPVRVRLDHAGQSFTLQPGDPTALNTGRGWRFEFHKHLAAQSQPFDVVASRQMGWHELPWGRMLAWLAAVALVLTALAQWQGQRAARRRAEELLRLGQVARLNTLGELAAGMAHELNQPLAAIASYASGTLNLLDEPPGASGPAMPQGELRQAMQRIGEQAERAGRVIKSVADFVRRREQVREAVAPASLIDAILPLLGLQAKKQGIRVHTQIAPGCPPVLCDRTMVEQVLLNLARNGVQAMPANDPTAASGLRVLTLAVSRTRLHASDDDEVAASGSPPRKVWVEFAVTDHGHGLSEAGRQQLFTPFFTTKAEGMGLGAFVLAGVVWSQAVLGIVTLIYAVPVWLGVLHQAGAAVVLAVATANLWLVLRAQPRIFMSGPRTMGL